MKMGERSFETPNLGSDLWSMGFDVDLALDTHSNTRKNNVGASSSAGSIVNGAVNIGYVDMHHMLLHRFDDDLNDGDISQITDLTNSLPKGDSENAQNFLAKISCHELTRELGGGQGSVQKGIETSIFGSENDGTSQGNNVLVHKPPLQPVDVYGRVTLYEGKLVLQLRHFNVNTNYPINVGECWLCREKMSNGSEIHSHKHVLQGLFQVNNEFVQMDIDHYIIPEQALEPDPPEVSSNMNATNLISNPSASSMGQHGTENRTLTLGEDIECSDALQNQHVNINTIGSTLHTPQRSMDNANESLQTPKGNSEIQYTETDLNIALSSAQQSLNSSVPIDSNSFLNSFTNGELTSVSSSIVPTPNESVIMNHVADSTPASSSFPPPSLALTNCNITNTNSISNAETLMPSNGNSVNHSTLNGIDNIQALCSSSNSIARNDGFIQHTTYEPNIGNKEQLDNYQNFFGPQYSYSYDSSALNQLSKLPVDTHPTSSSTPIYQSSPNVSSPIKPSVVSKRTEVGAKKRKSRAQRKPSSIKMKSEQDLSGNISISTGKNVEEGSKTLEYCLKGDLHSESLDVGESTHSEIRGTPISMRNEYLEPKPPPKTSLANTSKDEFSLCCPLCKLEFSNKNLSDFKAHTKVHKFDSSFAFICPICSKKFHGPEKYIRHLKTHNGKRHFCSLCNANYSRADKLRRHISNFHDSKKPYVCNVCSKAFSRVEYLKAHQNIHLGKKLECDECCQLFSSQFNLKIHKKLHLNEKLPFPCDLCEKAFARKDFLAVHVSKDHKNKRFKCDICSKLFSRNDVLKRHKVTHDIKRVTYDCEVCGKKFHRKDRLKAHSYDHKDTSKIETKSSSNRMRRKEIISKQLKTQKHKCNIWLKNLPSTLRREKHLRWHEKQIQIQVNLEKEHSTCEICSKTFKNKELIRRHMLRVHFKGEESPKPKTTDQKFFCDICSKGFTRSYNLKTHMKAHAKKSSEDDEILSELPTVLSASKSSSLKRKKKYLSLTKNADKAYSAMELFTSVSCGNSDAERAPLHGQSAPSASSLSPPLEDGFAHASSSHSNYNSHFSSHLPSELPIPTSSFCNSSPNSPINLSTEAISAAAYLLAHPFYEGSYQ